LPTPWPVFASESLDFIWMYHRGCHAATELVKNVAIETKGAWNMAPHHTGNAKIFSGQWRLLH